MKEKFIQYLQPKQFYMASTKGEKKPNGITLKNLPDDVWEKICSVKREILLKNKKRSSVSHNEAIYKLIQNNCA